MVIYVLSELFGTGCRPRCKRLPLHFDEGSLVCERSCNGRTEDATDTNLVEFISTTVRRDYSSLPCSPSSDGPHFHRTFSISFPSFSLLSRGFSPNTFITYRCLTIIGWTNLGPEESSLLRNPPDKDPHVSHAFLITVVPKERNEDRRDHLCRL